jgi:hypothetical protein
MSPGGFDSVATGLGGWLVAGFEGAVLDGGADGWLDDGGSGVSAGLAAELEEPPPLHADSRAAVVRERVSRGQSFMDRPWVSGQLLHRR